MNETDYITWEVHREFEKRIESENQSQNKRLDLLEASNKEIAELTTSVKLLMNNMEILVTRQSEMSAKLDAIEQRPAKRWDTVITGAISAVVGGLIGAGLAVIL